ncbi:MAG: hypothetical protein R6V58_06310, partial [Planctomycetota bacterium]
MGRPTQPTFLEKPTAARTDAGTRIRFQVAGPTDCTVAIVDANGDVVRHLAAGVLGPNAPKPFKKGALAQELLWDGRDDRGRKVDASACRARVTLGARAEFDRLIGHNPAALGSIHSMAVGPAGELFVYCRQGV